MNFLFTCGGTAGHINPAVGVAGKIKELMPDAKILFVGAEGMMETELVPREGYEIKTVRITNLQRSFKPSAVLHNINTVKNVFASTVQAKKIIRSFKPDIAIGTGGYVCYPVLKAAHSTGIPTLVHESNAVPGLTTKLLSGMVDCVMVGFEDAKANYKAGTNVVFTGTPVRTDFGNCSKAEAKRKLGLDENKPLLLSVWGSLGSDYMNRIMAELIQVAVAEQKINIIHSAGKRGSARMLTSLREKCPGYEEKGIDVREYIFNMPLVMAAADLIICRSGASTLAELAALKKPSVLVPSPNVTGNHQEKNARVLEKCGGAKVLLENEFDAQSLYARIIELIRDEAMLEKMSAAMETLGADNSSERIRDIVLSYVK